MVAVSYSNRCSWIAAHFMESPPMVSRPVGGRADLYFPTASFAGFSEHLFLSLFLRSRSLAVPGVSRDHHALRERDHAADRTIERWAGMAGTWDHTRNRGGALRSHLTSKSDVHRHRNAVSNDDRPESG